MSISTGNAKTKSFLRYAHHKPTGKTNATEGIVKSRKAPDIMEVSFIVHVGCCACTICGKSPNCCFSANSSESGVGLRMTSSKMKTHVRAPAQTQYLRLTLPL